MNLKRILTATILIPTVITTVLYSNEIIAFYITLLLTILGLEEFFTLLEKKNIEAYRRWVKICSILLISNNYMETNYINEIIFIFISGVMLKSVFHHHGLITIPIGYSFIAFFMIAYPLSFMIPMHNYDSKFLLFALTVTWAADICAYLAGKNFGKWPLAVTISPNKTWEGSIGGVIGSLLVGYGFSFVLNIPVFHLLCMAFLGNFFGQFGDLLESIYKRDFDSKDSGDLLPGHGGILDRIDAHIFCNPIIWYYKIYLLPEF